MGTSSNDCHSFMILSIHPHLPSLCTLSAVCPAVRVLLDWCGVLVDACGALAQVPRGIHATHASWKLCRTV